MGSYDLGLDQMGSDIAHKWILDGLIQVTGSVGLRRLQEKI